MKRSYSLRKNAQFQFVYRRGKSCANPHLVLLYVRKPGLKLGFSVSKKVGGAVVRNRVKRRLKESVRPLLTSLAPGYYVFVARKGAAEADFSQLRASLTQLLRRQRLVKEDVCVKSCSR